jgi:hydroxymethylpyrimidine pyrophosphatase-like HAD family hydrolase
LVTDLDGTLLDPSGEMHRSDRTAIGELLGRGIAVSIVTGRMYSGTRAFARALGLRGPGGCIDGSHIVEVENDGELWCGAIDRRAARVLRRALDAPRVVTAAFARDAIFCDERARKHLGYITKWSNNVAELGDLVRDLDWARESTLCATVSLGGEADLRRVASVLDEQAGTALQTIVFHAKTDDSGPVWGMVVRARGSTKATALEWIARHHGVPLPRVIAVGDWINDIPMLVRAGRSFAMAQAPREVRAAATEVLTADVWSGGGIAEAAERSGLL